MTAEGKPKALNILELYPEAMNLYGDSGNAEIMARRATLFGYDVKRLQYNSVADKDSLLAADIILGGGGQDSAQREIAGDLEKIKYELRAAVREVPTLVICGLYQLFGHYFESKDGDRLNGVDIFDAVTVGSNERMIGNIVESIELGITRGGKKDDTLVKIYGYENHSGETELLGDQAPFGMVEYGYGNTSEHSGIRWEGAITSDGNCIGTYMHGPVLSKNPLLADYILSKAVRNKYGESLTIKGQEATAELDKVSMLAARASIAADEAARRDQYS